MYEADRDALLNGDGAGPGAAVGVGGAPGNMFDLDRESIIDLSALYDSPLLGESLLCD